MCAITSPHSDASADQHMLLAMVGAGKMREFRELPTRQEKEQRVELLGGLVDFLREKWELEMPSVIFSVTGSAQELTLRPKFRDTVMSAMLSATRNTNAWIVAGGSDKGIMKLVGDALATSHQATTAIGIAPWGTIEGRTELTDDSEAQRELEESLYACTVRPPHLVPDDWSELSHMVSRTIAAGLRRCGACDAELCWRGCRCVWRRWTTAPTPKTSSQRSSRDSGQ